MDEKETRVLAQFIDKYRNFISVFIAVICVLILIASPINSIINSLRNSATEKRVDITNQRLTDLNVATNERINDLSLVHANTRSDIDEMRRAISRLKTHVDSLSLRLYLMEERDE